MIYLQSLVNVNDGKFVEIHRDKEDPTLDAQMTREIIGDELLVVSINMLESYRVWITDGQNKYFRTL